MARYRIERGYDDADDRRMMLVELIRASVTRHHSRVMAAHGLPDSYFTAAEPDFATVIEAEDLTPGRAASILRGEVLEPARRARRRG